MQDTSNSKGVKKKVLTARFSGAFDKKINFAEKTGIFLVSVGKENFENDALIAQLNLLKSNLKHVLILAADSLQRFNFLSHNLCNKKSILEDESERQSLKSGDSWLIKYAQEMSGLEINRWNEWKNTPDFMVKKNIVELNLNHDSEYALALKNSIEEYTKRFIKKLNDGDLSEEVKNELNKNCKNYLIEECAVLLMLAKKNFDYIFYPGKATPILAKTLDIAKKIYSPSVLDWLTIRLEKKTIPNYSNNIYLRKSIFQDIPSLDKDLSANVSLAKDYLECILINIPEDQKTNFIEEVRNFLSTKETPYIPAKLE